jgi:hypothetical protein
MCRFHPYTPPTKEETLETIYNVLAYICREGYQLNELDVGDKQLEVLGGEGEYATPYGKIWLYAGRKKLL